MTIGGMHQMTFGQDASLLFAPPAGPQKGALTLENTSFIYRKLPPEAELRELQINDIITVLVDYKSSLLSTGDANAKRTVSLNAALKDWLKFDGKNLYPAPQSKGDPRINGQLDSQFKTQTDMTLNDALTFRIAAHSRGHSTERQPRDRSSPRHYDQRRSLAAIADGRSFAGQSIGPDRTVRSDEVAGLRIEKREKGFIRDSYNRGWFTKWYDCWKPF